MRFFLSFLVVLTICSIPVYAQSVSEEENITLERAVAIAVENNSEVRRAADQVELAGAELMTRRSQYYPSLNVNMSGGHTYGRAFSTDVGGFTTGSSSMNMGTTASVILFDGFTREARRAQAQYDVQASERRRVRAEQSVAFEAADRFIELAQQESLVELQRAELQLRQEQLERIRSLIEAGSRPPTELYQQEADLLEAEQQVLQAERNVEVSRARLIRTLSLDPAGQYQFATDQLREITIPDLEDAGDMMEAFEGDIFEVEEVPPLNVLIEQARSTRTDLDALAIELDAANQNIRAARGNYYPTVQLSAGYNSRWNSVREPTFFEQLDQERSGSLGLSLSFPLFERFQRRQSVEQAQVQLRQVQYDLDDQERDLALQIREARAEWEQIANALELAEARLIASNRALEAAEERYRLGAAPLVELREATADQTRAASSLIQSRFDLQYQRTLLNFLRGESVAAP